MSTDLPGFTPPTDGPNLSNVPTGAASQKHEAPRNPKNANYQRSYRKTPQGWATKKWNDIKNRAGNADGWHPSYANVPLRMTQDEFMNWAVPAVLLFWQLNPNETASVDRADPERPYEIDNLRIIPWRENSRLARRKLARRLRAASGGTWHPNKIPGPTPLEWATQEAFPRATFTSPSAWNTQGGYPTVPKLSLIPGGSSGDWLSTGVNPIATVTNANSAVAYDQWTIVVATTANVTLTLPAPALVSGNPQFCAIKVDATSTKLVTVTHHASETIDGSASRVMWAGEYCVLMTDGSNWFKVAGVTYPMACRMSLSAAQSVSNDTITQVNLDTTLVDNTGLMADTTNHRINVQRANNYTVTGTVSYTDTVSTAQVFCFCTTAQLNLARLV